MILPASYSLKEQKHISFGFFSRTDRNAMLHNESVLIQKTFL